jgi:hypothetical protein
MMPGPPPVIVAKPASGEPPPRSTAAVYIGSASGVRAEPKTETAGPTSASASKPATNSPVMRRTRQVSLRVKAAACSRSSSDHWKSSRSSVGRPARARRLIVGFGSIPPVGEVSAASG